MKTWRKNRKRKRRPKLQRTIRVLVVDDDGEIRDILRERLFIEGFQVATADSGEEALAKFLVHLGTPEAFDVVTLDIRMHDLSGRQVLSLLRKIDQRVCVLMISGLDDLSQAVQSLSQGADDYLSKPIKIWDLRDRLITALGRRASLVQREVRKQERAFAGAGSGDWQEKGERGPEQAGRPGAEDSRNPDPMNDTGFGVEWGAAFSPSERLESHNDEFSEPASSLHGIAGRGKPACEGSELTPPTIKMGRENDPGNGVEERGTGENRARDPRKGDRGGCSAEDTQADRRASARRSEPKEGRRPGSLPGMASTSRPTAETPLERALELAQRVENSWEGCEGHGEQVAHLLEKLGASVATSLDLSYEDLDGLCLAARLHGLGIQDRQEENSREWTIPAEDGQDEDESALKVPPGRDREDGSIVARILCALLEEQERKNSSQPGPAASTLRYSVALNISLKLLGRQGKRQQEARHLDPALRDLLRDHEEGAEDQEGATDEKDGTQPGSGMSDPTIEKLLALYEVADSWIHLTHEGLGGLSPAQAFPELCASLASNLPAHPTNLALTYLRTQI